MDKTVTTNSLAEQLRVQKESLSTLLNHMPAMTFTKDVETGVYLACNQAFAEYAHKKTPEGVAGLTDFEIFEYSVAAHFVEDDRRALAMDRPYVLYEDVTDAVGNPRQFQTTKLKFHDESGRLCLLGMSMDVTEMEQVKADYKKAMNTRAIYEDIVDALAEDYFNLYYVDLNTNRYIEYGLRTEAGYRTTETQGKDFFVESKMNALHYIYEEDREKFIAALEKESLMNEIQKHGTFIMQYRLLIDGRPRYVNLKATRGREDDHHIIIGINNIDAQVRDQVAARRAVEDRKTYLRFSALNNNLIVLYMVDLETGQFSEYSSTQDYKKLGIETHGSEFFKTTIKNSFGTIHPDDLELFQSQVTKENTLDAIEQAGIFILDYRMMRGERTTYVRFKASRFEEDGKAMLIVGLLDEDVQIRREKKIVDDLSTARKMATIDALTGVKNKYAYSEAEKRMDRRVAEGLVSEFSVAVFDLNDLKRINDNHGHEIGDQYLKDSCRLICTCFKHSPVFRIGGDEFAVILEGEDYANQEELLERFEKQILANLDHDKPVVSFGCSRFNAQKDVNMQSVFARADAMMYREKMLLKSLGRTKEEGETNGENPVAGFGESPVVSVRKHILIADDIESNRELLGDLLQEDYEIIYASDGVEAMGILREHKDEIALVILDLYMPHMSGREVMLQMQVDEELMFIPVIFISVDLNAELDCLKIGAMDFIPKPYPDIEIIKARIARCIELSENRDLIRRTQRDKLTGLLNIDYFLRYVVRYDRYYRGTAFDAVVCNVNQFHQLKEQYGRQFGDLVLRSIGIGMNKLARQTGGSEPEKMAPHSCCTVPIGMTMSSC